MDFTQSAPERIKDALSRVGVNSNSYEVIAIAGDLSPRRYFRILGIESKFKIHFQVDSVMAMVFDSVKPPELETKIARTSDAAFVELTEFFSKHEIPVPHIYNDFRDIGVLLTEDLGSKMLIDLAVAGEPLVPTFYGEAITLIHRIQEIPKQEGLFVYERGFDQNVYLREINQFLDYVIPVDITEGDKTLAIRAFNKVAQELVSFKKVLVHRDFHSWNLMIDDSQKLRVIDFQDALLGVRSYDLVALLHERDIDLLLNPDLILALESQFFAHYEDNFLSEVEYPLTQLQRDLKVSGLFLKVKRLRGLDSYSRWVPGTINRIKLTLNKLESRDPVFREFANMLENIGVFN